MLTASHPTHINSAQFVALLLAASLNSVSLHILDLLRQWRSVQGHPLRGYIFPNYVQVLTTFLPVNCCCMTGNLNYTLAVFTVSNTSGDLNSVQALHGVPTALPSSSRVARQTQGPKYPMMYTLQCYKPYFSLSLQVKMWN